VAPPSLVVAQSSRSATDPSTPQLLPLRPSIWASPTKADMAHASVDMKTDVDEALVLIDELKAIFTKMVAAEEAKRAALPTALPLSTSLDALHSLSPSFPSPRQAIFKRRCLTSLG
jgi:hypothetical protein